MGRLIRAGTGLPAYKRLQVIIEDTGERYPQPTYPRVAVPIGEISSAVGEE